MKYIAKLLMVSLVVAPVVALSGCACKKEGGRDHGMMESKHKLARMKKEYGGK